MVHIKIPKKKVGPLSFGKESAFKLKIFPFVITIKELHLIGVGLMSNPIIKIHERWVKVLNEHEVYLYRNPLNDCHVCEAFYGKVKFADINLDPHISKILYWQP